MKRSSKIKVRRFDEFLEQDPIRMAEEAMGRLLAFVAIALVVAIVLVAEARLPEELRIGVFESTYASP
jgi:hypothetical protein